MMVKVAQLTLLCLSLLGYGCSTQPIDTVNSNALNPIQSSSQININAGNNDHSEAQTPLKTASTPDTQTTVQLPSDHTSSTSTLLIDNDKAKIDHTNVVVTAAIYQAQVKPEHPVRSFPEGTLYDLLVGELAGIRNNFDFAQEKYLTQARLTRDPNVVARAAQIAAYMDNRVALLEMSQLWVDIEPNNIDAHSLASVSLARYGQYDKAMTHAEFALLHGQHEPLLNLAVAANQASEEEREQLLHRYSTLESEAPNNTFVLLSKAMLQRQQKQLPDALHTVNLLLSHDALMQPAIMLKAQILHQQGNKKGAWGFLEQSLKSTPNNKRMRLQYARFLAEDDLTEAHRQLTILTKQYPNDPELIFSLALASKGLKRNEEAAALFTQLTQYPQTASSAHFELGLMAEQDNNIEGILLHYRSVQPGSQFLPATIRLCHFMGQKGQLDDARRYLKKLRLSYPELALNLYQIEAELLVDQGLIDEAYNTLSKAVVIAPNNIQLLYSRSLLSEQQGNFASSEQDLRTILAQDENNAMALNALGYTLTVHTERYTEAQQLILRALEINPEDPATIDSLGWVYYHIGNYEKAIEYLRHAFSKLPDPEIAAHLGEVLWVTGQHEEAISIWNKILENEPNNIMILQTMESLKAK